jgi:hypothetical protein
MTTKKQGKPKARSWVRWMIVSEYGDHLCRMSYETRSEAREQAHHCDSVISVHILEREIPAHKGSGK